MDTPSSTMQEKEYVPFAVEFKVTDLAKSIAFYGDILGFDFVRLNEKAKFSSFSFQGSILMLQQVDHLPPGAGSSVSIRFILENDLKQFFDVVKSRGATILKPLEEMTYGLSRFYVTDPDDYQLKFAQRPKPGST